MATIKFYAVNPETLEDVPVGTVEINGDEMTSDDPELVDIAATLAGSADEILEILDGWTNGYLRSEVGEEER